LKRKITIKYEIGFGQIKKGKEMWRKCGGGREKGDR
jgi:hypothetical protein